MILTTDLRKEVFEALGAASMCWLPRPDGVFDSTEAMKIGDDLCAKISKDTARLEWLINSRARLNPANDETPWELYMPGRGLPSVIAVSPREAIDAAMAQSL